MTSNLCIFCEIIRGNAPATIVYEDEIAMAFLDLRQAHAGHVLIVPRSHINDIRNADDATISAIGIAVARVARAVDAVFNVEGLSIWHSAGLAANQEVPHLHFHVHPRYTGDELLRIYPDSPALPPREKLQEWGHQLEAYLRATS